MTDLTATELAATELTLAEKAALVTGGSFWSTRAIERAGIPSIEMTDGPHGIRQQEGGGDHLGLGVSVAATCFPPAAGIASSFNPALVERVGEALGREARSQGVAVLLGPGINIKRSPLCGRNFEYFSEDPLVSGELGAAWVHGLQSQGVGASLKHFAANNQETNRMTVSADVDERTLREIYLPAFETVVKREQPWTVMCSYNRVNGVFAAENRWLLTTVLREEWGFEGLVVSDWGAVDDRAAAVSAGMDLEMPGTQPSSDAAIIAAVGDGTLDEARLDESVARVITLVDRARRDLTSADDLAGEVSTSSTRLAHHALAREAAAESIVLLRNEGDVLPIAVGQSIAVIGEFARSPRFQGAGSSQVNPTRVESALDALSARASVEFAPGYAFGRSKAVLRDAARLRAEAVALAERSDVALLFVGLPEGDESEGFDRTHLDLPASHLALIEAVTAVNPRTVVVLTNGGVVSLEPWHDAPAAILETWLLGQAGGAAIADVVLGTVNPSGRLAETIPLRLQDTPSYLSFPGDDDSVRYSEGVFVGYRHYDTVDAPVRYPFGFGLSYTTFAHSGFAVAADGRSAIVTVTNTGAVAGAEVVQVYVAPAAAAPRSPLHELRGFAKVLLEPGESRVVTVPLPQRAYSYWSVTEQDWVVAGGDYEVRLGRSSRDIVATSTVTLAPSIAPPKLSLDASVTAWLAHPVTGPLFRRAAAGGAGDGPSEGGTSVLEMVGSMPMRRLLRFPGVPIKESQLRVLLAVATNPLVEAIARMAARVGRR